MAERNSRRGLFWGCSTYPLCRASVNIGERGRSKMKGPLARTTRYCEAMVACDGAKLWPGREICRPCEDAKTKKTTPPKPLKGEKLGSYPSENRRSRATANEK
jgi:ssDNA-binding Zn-finger/Zn-ribbon topoisomerase 1